MAVYTCEFEAIGTHWELVVDTSEETKEACVAAVKKRIAQFDKDYSRFRSDSLVSAMSRKTGEYTLPEDAEPMFTLYKELYDATGGMVTPLVGDTLVAAGYDASYSLVPKKIVAPLPWSDALEYRFPKLIIKKPALLDVGAVGKGYCIDIVAKLIESYGITNYTVDAGGDIRHRSNTGQPLRVGLENPFDVSQVIGVVSVGNQSICGSAGNRRAWAGFTHIINPKTLTSPRTIAATWVIAEDTRTADGLSTALFFVEPRELSQAFLFEWSILYADHTISKSEGFNAELFVG